MFEYLQKEEFEKLKTKDSRIAVFREYPADYITPISAVFALKDQQDLVLLESAENDPHVGQYSCLGFDPYFQISAKGDQVMLNEVLKQGDPIAILRDCLQKKSAKCAFPLPGFTGGATGFFSYDAIRYFENIPCKNSEDDFPDLFFQFFRNIILFDHYKQKVMIISITEGDYEDAMKKIGEIYQMIATTNLPSEPSREICQSQMKIEFSDEEFGKKVQQIKEYIHDGEAFQVVISRKCERAYGKDPLDVYRALRMINPSPYMFYFRNPNFSVVGASPEKFVSMKNGIVESIPIAGTYPINEKSNIEELGKLLQEDPKEDAEHMMLVDLARNDLGKISETGSIRVRDMKSIQRLSHVIHMISFVQGKLRKGFDALDVIRAAFPAGTLSGAPKIRAMEIIDELEISKRNLYGGAICMIDSFGNLDSCIAIRMAVIRDQMATIRTGAGIVADSDPKKEAEETKHKAASVLKALDLAEAGI